MNGHRPGETPEPGQPAGSTASPWRGDPVPAESPADDESAPPGRLDADGSLLALVDRLATFLERSDLAELEVEAGDTSLLLRGPAAVGPPMAAGAADPAGPGRVADKAPPGSRADAAVAGASSPRNAVVAPLAGLFYASPNPGSPPFVAAGDEIAAGQVIGLIEAMKLFNEIKSDRAGRVVRVLVENGALVRARQPLVEVEPL